MANVNDLMTQKERSNYLKFIEVHKCCICNSAVGGKITVCVTETSLGTSFVCRCNACGAEKDITDLDSW